MTLSDLQICPGLCMANCPCFKWTLQSAPTPESFWARRLDLLSGN